VWVDNAGLVLLHPFLRPFFVELGLLSPAPGRGFIDRPAQSRAASLLQWVAFEEGSDEEQRLPLNKILCGLSLEDPVPRAAPPTPAERGQAAALVRAAIEASGILKNTSVDGFRRSFLQREGRLERDHDGWHLRLAARPYDIVLDRLPWGFSFIKLSFMRELLRVDR
jgi:hypothetical protein